MNVDRNIVRIARLTTGTGMLIHATGMAILNHAFEHRDPRKLTNLLAAIHKSARPEAFKVWVENAGPIVFEKGVARMDTSEAAKPWDLVTAASKPYFEAVENVGKPLTLEALLKVLQSTAEKIKKAENGKQVVAEGEDMAMLHALGARITGVIRDMGQAQAAKAVEVEVVEAEVAPEVVVTEPAPVAARRRIKAVEKKVA